jgi:cell wall-associated NlpC family hydrolase
MQVQLAGSRFAASAQPVAAMALLAAVLCAPEARAQVSVGGVRIDVTGSARADATARAVLTAIRIAERVARERRGGAASPGSDPNPGDTRAPTPSSRTPTTSAARVLPTAERYLGVPYRWGGTSPRTGFDCSGFVQYVFAKHGTRLPRTSREQATAGQRLPAAWSTLRAGDLVMFAEPGKRISHVAIYAGRRQIIHATASGRKVRYDSLDTTRGKWFAERIVAARRVSARGEELVSRLLAEMALDAARAVQFDQPDKAPPPEQDR